MLLHCLMRGCFTVRYKKPQTATLVDMTKELSNQKAYLVRQAVYDFLKNGYPITINAIAEATGVARQTIYRNKELLKLIDYYGKYIQKCTPPENEDEYEILMSIPNLQTLEEDVEKLLEENRDLNVRLLELKNQLFALEHKL